MEEPNVKTCFLCIGPVELAVIDHMVQSNDGYALLKNVAVEKCVQCGEVYFDEAASIEVDHALERARGATEYVEVPVVYATPAA